MNRIATSLCAAALIVIVSAGCDASPAGPTPSTSAVDSGAGALGDAASSTPAAGTTAPATGASAASADPWLLTTDGIGPYRLGQRIDSMPPGAFGPSTPIDSTNCPDLYGRAATGMYAGTLLLVVRHTVLVQIFSAGGDPGVHSAQGDKVGDLWATVEGRHPTGTYQTSPSGARAFFVPVGDRVMMFTINPIRPTGVGGYAAGLTDYSQSTFLSGHTC